MFLRKVDLTPGALDDSLRDEVRASKFFIVLCSRHAHEESKYLDDELRYFLESGGDSSRVNLGLSGKRHAGPRLLESETGAAPPSREVRAPA